MKLVVVAGTPGSGKTSVLMHTIRSLKQVGTSPAVVKIGCLWTDDDKRFERLDILVRTGLSRDMCPEPFLMLKKVFADRKYIELSDMARLPLSEEHPRDYFQLDELKSIVDKCNAIKVCC